MTNFSCVPYESADAELRNLYDEILQTLKLECLPNWVIYLGKTPSTLKGFWLLLKQVLLESSIDPLLTELCFFAVSYHKNSPYCQALHASNLLKLNKSLSYEALVDLVEGKGVAVLPDSYLVAVEVCVEHSDEDCSMPARRMHRLLNVGFSEKQATEILNLVGAALMFNSYTFAADLPIDSEFRHLSYRPKA